MLLLIKSGRLSLFIFQFPFPHHPILVILWCPPDNVNQHQAPEFPLSESPDSPTLLYMFRLPFANMLHGQLSHWAIINRMHFSIQGYFARDILSSLGNLTVCYHIVFLMLLLFLPFTHHSILWRNVSQCVKKLSHVLHSVGGKKMGRVRGGLYLQRATLFSLHKLMDLVFSHELMERRALWKFESHMCYFRIPSPFWATNGSRASPFVRTGLIFRWSGFSEDLQRKAFQL